MNWISVKDRLPQLKDNSGKKDSESNPVLVVSRSGEMFVGILYFYAVGGYRKKSEYHWSIQSLDEYSFYCGDFHPTHWMELPEAPDLDIYYRS